MVDREHRYFIEMVPELVQDYCIYILAKKIQLPEITASHFYAVRQLNNFVKKMPQPI